VAKLRTVMVMTVSQEAALQAAASQLPDDWVVWIVGNVQRPLTFEVSVFAPDRRHARKFVDAHIDEACLYILELVISLKDRTN
jgi:hypothetical protein